MSSEIISYYDQEFVDIVIADVIEYLNVCFNVPRSVLIFPPVNNYRRYLIHQTVSDQFADRDLTTFSIGGSKTAGRRTVVCNKKLVPSEIIEKKPSTPIQPSVPKKSNPTKKDTKIKSPGYQVYVPPHARKSIEPVTAVPSETESPPQNQPRKKNKRPDRQLYVPRALRRSCGIPNSEDRSNSGSSNDESSGPKTLEREPDLDSVESSEDYQQTSVIALSRLEPEIDAFHESEIFSLRERKLSPEHPSIIDHSQTEIVLTSNHDLSLDESSQLPYTNEIMDTDEPTALEESNDGIQSDIKMSFTENEDVLKESEDVNNTIADESTDSDSRSSDLSELATFGDALNPSLIKELTETVGFVKIVTPTSDYHPFQSIEDRVSDGESIIEIYDFSPDFKTEDLMEVFAQYASRGFRLNWVDDTHALGVFPSPILADEALACEFPSVKTRPLKLAIAASKAKASGLRVPSPPRPKTCVSLARRLVGGALGIKLHVTNEKKEAEELLLEEARAQRRLDREKRQRQSLE